MESVNVETLVDKLVEKIGLAVNKLQPITEEVLRQYQMEHIFLTIVGAIILLTGIGTGLLLIKKGKALDDNDGEGIGLYIVGGLSIFFGLFVGLPVFINGLACYIAPLPNILGL